MRVIDAQTVEVNVEYVEPVVPENDLAYTSIYYKVNGGATVAAAKTTATKPQGGGAIALPLLVPAPSGQKTKFDFVATATDLSGNEGAAVAYPFEVERLAPGPVTNFTVA